MTSPCEITRRAQVAGCRLQDAGCGLQAAGVACRGVGSAAHVQAWRAVGGAARLCAISEDLGEPEVCDLDGGRFARVLEEQVLGLEVAVRDAHLVQVEHLGFGRRLGSCLGSGYGLGSRVSVRFRGEGGGARGEAMQASHRLGHDDCEG